MAQKAWKTNDPKTDSKDFTITQRNTQIQTEKDRTEQSIETQQELSMSVPRVSLFNASLTGSIKKIKPLHNPNTLIKVGPWALISCHITHLTVPIRSSRPRFASSPPPQWPD
ncbi:LOW QUALITY PROTEIN: hypothetical protein YC2023_062557 [Brassica napus]